MQLNKLRWQYHLARTATTHHGQALHPLRPSTRRPAENQLRWRPLPEEKDSDGSPLGGPWPPGKRRSGASPGREHGAIRVSGPIRFTPAAFYSPGRSQRTGWERRTPTMGGRHEDTACLGPQGHGGQLRSNGHQPKGRVPTDGCQAAKSNRTQHVPEGSLGRTIGPVPPSGERSPAGYRHPGASPGRDQSPIGYSVPNGNVVPTPPPPPPFPVRLPPVDRMWSYTGFPHPPGSPGHRSEPRSAASGRARRSQAMLPICHNRSPVASLRVSVQGSPGEVSMGTYSPCLPHGASPPPGSYPPAFNVGGAVESTGENAPFHTAKQTERVGTPMMVARH